LLVSYLVDDEMPLAVVALVVTDPCLDHPVGISIPYRRLALSRRLLAGRLLSRGLLRRRLLCWRLLARRLLCRGLYRRLLCWRLLRLAAVPVITPIAVITAVAVVAAISIAIVTTVAAPALPLRALIGGTQESLTGLGCSRGRYALYCAGLRETCCSTREYQRK
jgi:hypothetical protein